MTIRSLYLIIREEKIHPLPFKYCPTVQGDIKGPSLLWLL
jgi:hypothetical protein